MTIPVRCSSSVLVRVVLTVVMGGALASPGLAVVLVRDGKPAATIIVAPTAPESVQRAGAELQEYLEKVTGAKLPIQSEPNSGKNVVRILIGASSSTRALGLDTRDLKCDGFKIQTGDSWLAILGRDYAGPPISGYRNPWQFNEAYSPKLKLGAFGEAGTLNGVYQFLEEFVGVRWYMPGPLGTVIPKRGTIEVRDVTIRRSPDFEYRYPWFCNFDTSDEDALWFRRAGFGAPYPAQIIDSFGLFLKHKDAHPEYFALIGGQRDFSNRSCIQAYGNLCLSNPGVVKQWVEDINDYFDKNPNQYIFPLSPNDGMMKICECKACQAQIDPSRGPTGKFSNYVWSFIDKVAAGVAAKHPDRLVGGIAYEAYNAPPTRIKKLHPNVAVMICKTRGSYADPKYYERMQKAVAGWREKAANVYIWEYYLYSWDSWRGLPVFFPHSISADLRALKGVTRGEFIEAESDRGGTGKIDCPGMAHLNLYATGKLLWQADLDVGRLMAEYYTLFYGPAREPMKEFWSRGERIWMARSPLGNALNAYRTEDLKALADDLAAAKAKTAAGSVYRQRVELIEKEFATAKVRLTNVLVTHPPKITLAGPVSGMVVDGTLNDPAWREFDPIGFVDKDGEAAAHKTWMYASWDNKSLCLAFINYEPEMAKLTVGAAARDQSYNPAVWDDDSMEIFLVPDADKRRTVYQWIINAKGVVWDAAVPGGIATADTRWNSHIEVKTKLESNRWILEARIPFRDLGMDGPPIGRTLGANFYRNRYCGRKVIYSEWSPSVGNAHLCPERFGRIGFGRR